MTMTSNCDVTNSTHQIQMTTYAVNETSHENFLHMPLIPRKWQKRIWVWCLRV